MSAAGERLAIILAAIDARGTVRASVSRFLQELGDRGEVILVDASRDGTAGAAAAMFPRLRVLRQPAGRLAPELWRDGLEATDAPLVALSTAQMVPRAGWLAALRDRLDSTGAAGVGGPIAPGSGLSATDRALYLMRYANYLPPVPESSEFEPPGDNALYRRERLLDVGSAWRDGFWEVEVHRQLRARGESLASASDAIIEFRGGTALGPALKHRMAHARHFGAGRMHARTLPARLARSAAAPAVPAVLMARIARALRRRGEPVGRWVPAIPRLSILLASWSLGEAAGACLGPPRARRIE